MVQNTQEKRKFLSKGSFGCVFDPPLACDNANSRTNSPSGSVGKVFEHQQDFEEEVEAYKKVAILDPEHKWSLPLLNECVVNLDAINNNNSNKNTAIDHCPFIVKNDKHLFFQIVIPYGGITLWNLFGQQQVSLVQFIDLLRQVLVATSDMTKNGYVHLDIKPMNILVNEGRVILIDFSLLKKHEDVYQMDNAYLLRSKYIWYPPEFYISSKLLKKSNMSDIEMAQKSLYIYEIPKYGLKYDASVIKKQEQALVKYIKFLRSKANKSVTDESVNDIAALNVKLSQKIDVYGIGVTFLNVYESRGWKHPILHNLLKNMTHADPRKRISVFDAKDGVTKLCNKNKDK